MNSEKGNARTAPDAVALEPGVVSSFRAFSRTSSLIVAVVGASVLVGWALDSAVLIALAPRLVAMNPLTALCFVLAGVSLWLHVGPAERLAEKLWPHRLAQALAVGVAILGVLRLSELLLGWQPGVDLLFFRDKLATAPGGWPNRMAPNTALNFLLVGSALLLLDVETRRGRRPAQFLVLGSALVSFLALMGYAYGVPVFYRLPLFIPMALNTAAAFLVLSVGVLCARPERGVLAPVTSDSAGGRLARWLLPAAVAVPVLLGWLRWQGEDSGLYGTSIGIALYTTSMVVVLTLLVWRSALHLDRADKERQRAHRELIRAQEELKSLNQSLEQRVKQRTAELQISESKFRGLLEMAPDAILTVDRTGRIVLANAQAEKLFGYRREELVGQSIELLVPERFREKHRSQCKAYFADPQGRAMQAGTELYAVRKEGSEFPAEMTLSALDTEQGVLVTSIVRDLTERKRAEEEIRRLNESLEQRVQQRTAELETANKELEAFTYSVSHDLRAPLRQVDGFSRLLLEEHAPQLTDQARHYLERVRQGTQHMGQLVDDLLNLARVARQEPRRQVTGLSSLVEEVRQELEPDCAGRAVEWRIDSLPFVDCDPALMKQVFANLLSNALKFTRPRAQAIIEVGQAQLNGEPVVCVRDNGVGFSMKYADKLFGVFQRLHRPEDFEGTGVGLATVQRIVRKHGGRVWAEAELDKGATFYFTLGRPEGGGATP